MASALDQIIERQHGVSLGEPARNGGPAPTQSERYALAHPDGFTYLSRTVCGIPEVAVFAAAERAGLQVCLVGPPGTGKTSAFRAYDPAGIVVECDEGTSAETLIGGFVPTPGGHFRWDDRELTIAAREGRRILLDEVVAVDPRVLCRLHALFDARRRITLKEHEGEVVEARQGFWPMLAYNPDLPGMELPDPLRSRFHLHIEVGTDYGALHTEPHELRRVERAEDVPAPEAAAGGRGEGLLGIDRRIVDAAQKLDEDRRRGLVGWAPQLRELSHLAQVERAFGLDFALRNLVSGARAEHREPLAECLHAVVGEELDLRPLCFD